MRIQVKNQFSTHKQDTLIVDTEEKTTVGRFYRLVDGKWMAQCFTPSKGITTTRMFTDALFAEFFAIQGKLPSNEDIVLWNTH